jgi:hypothetical protein
MIILHSLLPTTHSLLPHPPYWQNVSIELSRIAAILFPKP